MPAIRACQGKERGNENGDAAQPDWPSGALLLPCPHGPMAGRGEEAVGGEAQSPAEGSDCQDEAHIDGCHLVIASLCASPAEAVADVRVKGPTPTIRASYPAASVTQASSYLPVPILPSSKISRLAIQAKDSSNTSLV